MSLASILRRLFFVLFPLALLSTVYLYFYAIFHGCAFPTSDGSGLAAFHTTLRRHFLPEHNHTSPETLPTFRLLVLADPQLEGDSSLPDPQDSLLPTIWHHWSTITQPELDNASRKDRFADAARDIITRSLPQALYTFRKAIDLFGNDFYLAHIYRTLHWWTRPTHVTVLGDLIGSQWVSNEEFAWRGWRYWNRVFVGGKKIEQQEFENSEALQTVGEKDWAQKIINVVGNHDIGYAGDISEQRLSRFEDVFGPANWDIRFQYPALQSKLSNQTIEPTVHVVVLNSLSLDTPALSEPTQSSTYDFINSVISTRSHPVEDRTSFTLLLTHLPLHKPAGVCVDEPYFTFWDHDDSDGRYHEGGLREQNHLSDHISHRGVLEGIFGIAEGKGRNGLILTGHDHEGCDTWHHHIIPSTPDPSSNDEETNNDQSSFQSQKYHHHKANNDDPGIREVTLRSMMGQYSGNAGLLSAWFDFEAGEWKYDIQMCKLGVQHIWWAVHIVDLVTLVVGCAWLGSSVLRSGSPPQVKALKVGDSKEEGSGPLGLVASKEANGKAAVEKKE